MDELIDNYEHWSLTVDDNDLLWATFDKKDSPVNTLNEETMGEFEHILDNLQQNHKIKAFIIRSGKKSGFIAGADVTQFKSLATEEEATALIQRGQEIFNKLESLPVKTIALIEGFCLGGGLELALSCKIRIAENSPKTRLGLPEVKLGIHPGWGGTIRLPKLIGAPGAMELILSGKIITAKEAKKRGVVDEAVPKRLLEKTAYDFAMKENGESSKFRWQALTNLPPLRPLLGRYFKYQLDKKISPRHYPAPFRVVQNWVEYGVDDPAAMTHEAESIGQLMVQDTAKNLLRVFFLQEKLKSLGKGIDFKPKHIHVVGAGVMGGDIAAWCACQGFTVTIQDQAPKLISNAVVRAFELAQKRLKEKHLIVAAMDRFIPDIKGDGIARADVIIEAITEKLHAKQELFASLEKKAKKDAILATNTSTIPLEEIGASLRDPDRLVGIHFFNPVAKMQLVEVVQTDETHPSAVDKAMAFVRAIDHLPLPVKSSPGFLVNRILMPYMLEAVALLEEGVSGPVIDKAAVDFGMPMGPIELADAVGLDICLAALEKLSKLYGSPVPEILKDRVAKGELGRKSGKGFYSYRKNHAIKPKIKEEESLPSDLTDRLVLRLLNESIACLREGIVDDADLLDAGCIFGFGFPPFRGGPIHYIREQGETRLKNQLKEFEKRYGDRFTADKGWKTGTTGE